MTLTELKRKYNLIGSLLENININKVNNSVTLEIDFCYWQQADFVNGNKETGMVKLCFSECGDYNISNHKINSDEIVNVEITDDTIDICVENDLTNDYYHIIISSSDVEFTEI